MSASAWLRSPMSKSPGTSGTQRSTSTWRVTTRKSEALKGLSSAAGFLRSRLGRELRIRRVPELRFKLDRTHEHAARISELLAEVKTSEEHGDDEDTR